MSWMNWFFKRKGVTVIMSQDSTTFTGDVAVTGGTTLTGAVGVAGAITATGGMTVTGGTVIAGVSYFSSAGTPEGAVTAARKGDHCTDYTNGNEYIFTGTAGQNTGWKLVTRAA